MAVAVRRMLPARAGWTAPRWVTLALLLGTALQLVPVVAFSTVLTQDGPAHVYSAWVLDHIGSAGPVGTALRENFRIDLSPVPNMLTTFVLAALIPAAGPDVAERVLVGAIVVGLVAVVWWTVRQVDRRAGWLALGALPLAGSYLVAYGFYNFCLGVIGFVLVLGLALRRREGWSARSAGGLAALLAVTWLAHLLPFALGVAAVGLLALARTVAATRGGTRRQAAVVRHLLPPAIALVPSLVLTVVYLRSGAGPGGAPGGAPSWGRLLTLVSGSRPFSVGTVADRAPAVIAAAGLWVLVVAALVRRPAEPPEPRRLPERAAVAALLASVTLVISVTPSHLGNDFGFLVDRLAWFPVLVALVWGATRLPRGAVATVVAAVLVVGASAAVFARLPWESRADAQVGEVLSVASAIRPGSTFVLLRYVGAYPRPGDPDPLRHASSRLAMRSRSVDVGLYEAAEPYFQLTFSGGPDLRRKLDPDLRGLELVPPVVDLPAVRGRLDYVVVVGLNQAPLRVRASSPAEAVRTELAAHYRRVATSGPHGLVTVWRARGPSAGGAS